MFIHSPLNFPLLQIYLEKLITKFVARKTISDISQIAPRTSPVSPFILFKEKNPIITAENTEKIVSYGKKYVLATKRIRDGIIKLFLPAERKK